MLNLLKRAMQVERQERGLAELLPWMLFLRPNLVLNKDGSLMACYQVKGMAVEGVGGDAIDQGALMLEQALRQLDHRYSLWFTVHRSRWHEVDKSCFVNPGSARMNQLYQDDFHRRPHYRNQHYCSLLFRPETMQGIWQTLFTPRGGSLKNRLWAGLFHREALKFKREVLDTRVRKFEETLVHFESLIADLGLVRLQDEHLAGFLNRCASPTRSTEGWVRPPQQGYLDSQLGEDSLEVQADHLRFSGVAQTAVSGALSVKGWPSETWPEMLDEVLSVPAELTLSQVFRVVDSDSAKRVIKNVQRFHLNLQKSMFSYFREALVGEESAVQDTGRAVSAADARDALTDMAAARRLFGYLNLTIMVHAAHREELEEGLKQVAASIRQNGFLLLRERLHLVSAWAGTLPGQWGELVRWHFVSSANWADLAPIRASDGGARDNAYLARQTGREAPALSLFTDDRGHPWHFNLHWQDLGHTMVVGPSRSGKSVWVNFIISQYQKYQPRIFIFDKDHSCRISTLMQDGQYLDGAGQAMNPLAWVDDENHRRWLVSWLELLLTSRGYRMASGDDTLLWEALEGLSSLSPSLWRLKSLSALLPRHLKEELEPWLEGGPLGHCFDHVTDALALSRFTAFEMGELLRDPRQARATLEYLFRRIDRAIAEDRTTPTLIYVEEAWFMLSDPWFSGRLRDWLKTLPKRLGLVILATQSLDDLSGASIFSTLADNIPTRIFLPNRQARVHRSLYVGQFGLNDEQIARIERATEKRHYYLVNPTGSHLLEARFPASLLYWLRSDAQAQACFDRCFEPGNPDWKQAYLQAMEAA